jgi:4-diphosphocytidyl-2-C-methyl-D-erythritol kinase
LSTGFWLYYVFFCVYDTILTMPQIRVEAPAKLNLHLQIGGRRPDGFHDLESLFFALAFGDTLCLEPASAPLEILMDWQTKPLPELSPEKNIISRAVSLFRGRSGFNGGLKISVIKRIPLGGGLGGGSSDAAATLLGLNRLLAASSSGKKALGRADLLEMGAELGSDVPFFLYNTPAAWVSGRGELVQPLDLPETARNLSVVLAGPGFPSDTARAYSLLDSWRGSQASVSSPNSRLARESFFGPPHEWQFFNDFLSVFRDGAIGDTAFSEEGIVYQQIIDSLRELGADFAGLSGSGSTCFGVFSRPTQVETARKVLEKRCSFVIISFLLAS